MATVPDPNAGKTPGRESPPTDAKNVPDLTSSDWIPAKMFRVMRNGSTSVVTVKVVTAEGNDYVWNNAQPGESKTLTCQKVYSVANGTSSGVATLLEVDY